jgi:hypothetical protein
MHYFDVAHFEFDADIVPLPSLKRLEWWYNTSGERSGGINSLTVVLQNAPGLRCLFIAAVMNTVGYTGQPASIFLPHLEILWLHSANALLLRQIATCWSLPRLTHVIIDSLQSVGILWEAFGPQLEVVEFGRSLRFLTHDFLTPCMESCPNLRELNYYICFTAPPMLESPGHTALTSIAIHCAQNDIFDGTGLWDHVTKHFGFFRSGRIPNLRRLRILGHDYPKSPGFLDHPLFSSFQEACQDSGWDVQAD